MCAACCWCMILCLCWFSMRHWRLIPPLQVENSFATIPPANRNSLGSTNQSIDASLHLVFDPKIYSINSFIYKKLKWKRTKQNHIYSSYSIIHSYWFLFFFLFFFSKLCEFFNLVHIRKFNVRSFGPWLLSTNLSCSGVLGECCFTIIPFRSCTYHSHLMRSQYYEKYKGIILTLVWKKY